MNVASSLSLINDRCHAERSEASPIALRFFVAEFILSIVEGLLRMTKHQFETNH